ncbi:MAG TPA: DUF2934 domain-containing protein [Xanthobacteraceae bacterium]|nr:DUF2934 domain-containing protein [Xanthobacteraceae bacterium]
MKEREEAERNVRIRRRAYQLWEEDGRPEGRAQDYWDKASELIAIEDNYASALEPVPDPDSLGPSGEPVEPIEAVENAGEFPTLTDQDEQEFPSRKALAEENTARKPR